MNKLSALIIIAFISLTIFSCKDQNSKTTTNSKFYTDSIYSKHLSEYRKHDIYLPKGFDRKKKYPIIFATDGGTTSIKKSPIKKILDSLIQRHTIKPIIYIVSHVNLKVVDSTNILTVVDGNNLYTRYRNFEYVNKPIERIPDSSLVNRFKNHMLYFKDELIPISEKNIGQTNNKKNRYFYGVSNGGGFGINLSNLYPNKIGTYICFSPCGGDIKNNTWKKNIKYPRLYIQYGNNEPTPIKNYSAHIKYKYKELNLFSEIKEFNGGHDGKIWRREFIKTISKLFSEN